MGACVVLSLLLLPTFVGQSNPVPAPGKVTVAGRVVDSQGQPVANALVSAYLDDHVGPIPGALTHADGTFAFQVDAFTSGRVSASKREAGFPDAVWALYGSHHESIRRINATPAASPIQIELRFEEPDAVIDWKLLSKVDRSPVKSANCYVAWSDDPKTYMQTGCGEEFKFVLPKHPVSIRIEAKGFREWNSADSAEFGSRPVLFTPGTKDERTILLEPAE